MAAPNKTAISKKLRSIMDDRKKWEAIKSKFSKLVDRQTDTTKCWPWLGAVDTKGYGRMTLGHSYTIGAHRLSYIIATGNPLEDLCACHHCDNPICVNPSHLFSGTHKDNSDDKVRKGRARSGSQPGANNPNAKINENDVEEIRKRIANGETNIAIAKDYPVSHALISRIRVGRSWASNDNLDSANEDLPNGTA